MSNKAMEWALEAKCEQISDKALLLILAYRANEEKGRKTGLYEAFPAVPNISRTTGMSRSLVYKSLNRLYAAGLITKLPKKGSSDSNTYRLNVDAPNTEQRSDDAKTTRPKNSEHRDDGGTGQSRQSPSQPKRIEPGPAKPSPIRRGPTSEQWAARASLSSQQQAAS